MMSNSKPLITLYLLVFFTIIGALLIHITACHNQPLTAQNTLSYPIDTTIKAFNTLPDRIKESSGLVHFENAIWTHNDSGDGPCLYQLDIDNQKLTKTVLLENAKSKDWEELAQDETSLYVGDFGNNGGHRQDLVIYKVPKSELTKDTVSNFEVIEFRYPDQERFDRGAYQHNFDCEAMIVSEDSIYLFSKNHQDYQTRLYRLPKTAGKHIPQLLDSFDTKGTITAAGIDKTNKILVLSGYKFSGQNGLFNPYLWVFWDYKGREFFDGKNQRINLPMDKQVEGICLFEEEQFLMSSEAGSRQLGEFYLFDVKKWID